MKYNVGGEVDTYCGKCKLERTHKIVAVDPDGSIVKVVCATCESYHKYKAPKVVKERSAKVSKSTKKDKPVQIDFSMIEMMTKSAVPYSVRTLYQIGDVIDHTTFGLGQVVAIEEDKIDVHFGVGIKKLVHGRN